MDRMLYTAMTGARQIQQAQKLTANNLANISTGGFRADLAAMRSMPLFGHGLPSRVFAMTEKAGVNFTPGPLTATGRELDIAINGEGWIAVQGRDGREAYTRAGALEINTAGQLQTASGLPVLGDNGPITVPEAAQVVIGKDGTLSIVPRESTANDITQVDRIKLVRPPLADLVKGPDGLFRTRSGRPAEADAAVEVVSGTLEMSNVNAAAELVNMIELAHQFEMQVKMMRNAEENDQRTARILQIS